VQQHVPHQEIPKIDLSVQAPSLSNNDILKVATVGQQIITERSGAMSEKDKILFITKIVLNLMKQNCC
jgi:hypothetical protein